MPAKLYIFHFCRYFFCYSKLFPLIWACNFRFFVILQALFINLTRFFIVLHLQNQDFNKTAGS